MNYVIQIRNENRLQNLMLPKSIAIDYEFKNGAHYLITHYDENQNVARGRACSGAVPLLNAIVDYGLSRVAPKGTVTVRLKKGADKASRDKLMLAKKQVKILEQGGDALTLGERVIKFAI